MILNKPSSFFFSFAFFLLFRVSHKNNNISAACIHCVQFFVLICVCFFLGFSLLVLTTNSIKASGELLLRGLYRTSVQVIQSPVGQLAVCSTMPPTTTWLCRLCVTEKHTHSHARMMHMNAVSCKVYASEYNTEIL